MNLYAYPSNSATAHQVASESQNAYRIFALLQMQFIRNLATQAEAVTFPHGHVNRSCPQVPRVGKRCGKPRQWGARVTNSEKESLIGLCRDRGLRITGPRRTILETLEASDDHPDVEELHRRVQQRDAKVNIATVYRTINMLAEHGLIERHTFDDGRLRFEKMPAEHHDHFIDTETGDVIEFRSDEIERLQEEIARQHGFEIVSHRLEIYVKRRRR
jgi:Fur family ferric uptake transcriptional regulator